MAKLFTIAIDGPAGVGKSTVAKAVARRLGFAYVDSGATYRAAALKVLESGVSPDDPERVVEIVAAADIRLEIRGGECRVLLDGEDVESWIRTPEVTLAASKVSRLPQVRQKLVTLQRSVATDRDVVMEGRDIGTVVLPGAPLKIFLKARAEERARRRLGQEQGEGINRTLAETAKAIARRDRLDTERSISPLVPAADAVEIDSTALTADRVVERIIDLAKERKLIETG
ncbi:MAG TPA: (d)CMP kinase [Terriglobia bacterium]|nr:(d)CMP kinase [Terriglobia bacterium]